MSSHLPIPLYPCPPVSLHRAQEELSSDEYSDFPPILTNPPLHSPTNRYRPRSSVSMVVLEKGPEQCSSPSDKYSDFPPIREHKSTFDSSPTNLFRPCSSKSVVRKGPEQCSSPIQSEFKLLPSHLPRYSRRRNKGLGHKDILNTIEVRMKYPKVRN
jgi:hypothetical protein